MTKATKRTGQRKDISKRDVVRILMQEIADMRRELKEDIAKCALKSDLDALKTGFNSLRTEFKSLRSEVHQNQLTFMHNHDALEQRVKVLEVTKA